jgi:hypothetical protein
MTSGQDRAVGQEVSMENSKAGGALSHTRKIGEIEKHGRYKED